MGRGLGGWVQPGLDPRQGSGLFPLSNVECSPEALCPEEQWSRWWPTPLQGTPRALGRVGPCPWMSGCVSAPGLRVGLARRETRAPMPPPPCPPDLKQGTEGGRASVGEMRVCPDHFPLFLEGSWRHPLIPAQPRGEGKTLSSCDSVILGSSVQDLECAGSCPER